MSKFMTTSKLAVILLATALWLLQAVPARAYLNLPRDSSGWTIFTPSSDSRILYVSTSGNNTTATVYTQANHPNWSNPKNPGAINAYRTYAAAFAQTRDGYPDWILFKRGDTFEAEAMQTNVRNGRSATEPFLISDYGTSGDSPILNPNRAMGFNPTNNKQYWALTNLDFYYYKHDPTNAQFDAVTEQASEVFRVYASGLYRIQHGLIEGNRFRYHKGASVQCEQDEDNANNIEIRRNLFINSWSFTADKPQGLYGSHVHNFKIEENVFDHNGYYSTAPSGGIGPADMFCHNVYLSGIVDGSISRNVSTRPSSMHFKFTSNHVDANKNPAPLDYYVASKNLVVNDNFMYDGEIGISLGGNDTTKRRYENIVVTNNIITDVNATLTTTRSLGWGYDIQDYDGGNVSYNMALNSNKANSYFIRSVGTYRNVTFTNNISYNWQNLVQGFFIDGVYGTDATYSTFVNNHIVSPTNSANLVTVNAGFPTPGHFSFSGNRYFSTAADGQRFRVSGTSYTGAAWASATGDAFTWGVPNYSDPTRDIGPYMASIGMTGTKEAFVTALRGMSRYNWDLRLMAENINAWIRAGFYGTAPPPTCDASHLSYCGTESACTSVGGNWCDSLCQDEACPAPLTPRAILQRNVGGCSFRNVGSITQRPPE